VNRNVFEQKIQPILQYIGAIGAALMSVAYVIAVSIMIVGFTYHQTVGAITFSLVNAGVGLIIMQFLKVQGVLFAENDPENRAIVTEYYGTRTKDKKPHSMRFYWITSAAKDIFTKGVSTAATTFGLVYIVIEGSNDYSMLLLALVNLIMFFCFGLLSLNNAYNYYYNSFIPYVKEQIKNSEVKSNDQIHRQGREDVRAEES